METDELFREIRSQSRRKGLNIRDLFEDYDLRRQGKVSFFQLRCVFQSLAILVRESVVTDLFNQYKTEANQFNYHAFLAAFENLAKSVTTMSDEGLREFRKLFSSRNTTLSEFLRDADRYHLGRVTEDAFLGAVGTSALTQQIARQYMRPPHNDVYYIELERDLAKVSSTSPSRRDRTLPPFFPAVVHAIRTKAINVYGILAAHDRRRRQKILSAHFVSEFGNLGLGLSVTELHQLCDAFSDGNEFDYLGFVDAIEKAEISPVKRSENSEEVTVNIVEVLKNLQKTIVGRRVNLELTFARFDMDRTGILPITAFRRICTDEGFGLNRAEMNALIEEFQVGDKDVNYRTFILAVNPTPKSVDPEIDKVIQSLKSHLQFRKVQLRPALQRYDPQKTGKVTWVQFLSALRNVQFDLDGRESRLLKSRTTDSVDIAALCDAVDPPSPPPSPSIAEAPPPKKPEPEIISPTREVLDVLAKISAAVDRFDVDLTAEFRQYQSSSHNLIRISSFRSVLYNLPSRLSTQDVETLLAHYADRSTSLVDRQRFINDVSTFGNPQFRSAQGGINEVAKRILRRFKAHLNARKLAAVTLFQAEKGGVAGALPKERIRTLFSRIGFQLQLDEERELFAAFEAQGMPEQINYRRLLDQMENETITSEDLAAAKVTTSFSNSGEYDLVSALVLIHGKLVARRRKPNDIFVGVTEDTVSLSDFRQRMQNYGLIIPVPDIERIARKYRVNLRGDIDWKTFVEDCDSIRAVQPPR